MIRNNILITGASSGLGREMARQFAAKGRNLALCARRLDLLEALRDELLTINPNIEVVVQALDVRAYDAVFRVFEHCDQALGGLDRVIVNAGIGKGQPLGSGAFNANRQTAETNFVAALAQCEAAMAIFRRRNAGHLVTVSSIAALRGLPGTAAVYSASKAALATLTEALRADTRNTPIAVSCLYPGFILTDINRDLKRAPFRVDVENGTRALVRAIEREKPKAYVPAWPWAPLGQLLKILPLRAVAALG